MGNARLPSTFVSITPCRLFVTRPAPLTVGDRNTPLSAGEDFVRPVWGTNGNCTIPTAATGISYNLTVPTGINGFLTVYPPDAARPLSSNINPVGGEGVKANSGIVGLSAAGAITVYTLNGPTDALMDITGYFLPASAGPPGPPGAAIGGVEFGSGAVDTTLTVNLQATVVASIVVTAPSAGSTRSRRLATPPGPEYRALLSVLERTPSTSCVSSRTLVLRSMSGTRR